MRARTLLALTALPTLLLVAPPSDAAGAWCDGHRATIVGTDRSEVIVGTRRADVIVARGGDDTVDGRGGDDRICGGYGADRLRGGPGRDRVFGGMDRLSFDDEGSARTGDQLRGGPGRDRLVPGRDTRRADDVSPDAILWDTSPRGVHLDVGAGVAFGDGPDSFVGTATWLVGSRFGDVVDGSARADLVNTGRGADVVRSRRGNDRVIADGGRGPGQGDDLVWGGSGDDQLTSAGGQDRLHGGPGDDVLDDFADSADVLAGDSGDDLLVGEIVRSTQPQRYAGGAGRDRLSVFSNLLNPTGEPATGTWDMETGEMVLDSGGPQRLTASGFESGDLSTFGTAWTVVGTTGADDINAGSMLATSFTGREGNDSFLGSAYDDTFDGGPGTDRSRAMGAGFDTCVSVEVFEVDDCESVTP